MSRQIFVNYRRDETAKEAQLLTTLLAHTFGKKNVFLDKRTMNGGSQWVQAIEKQVAASSVMIVLIGSNWTVATDDKGNRRLDDPDDFVRFEIALALQRQIPLLPVLLDGTKMPRPDQLPSNLAPLCFFHALQLRSDNFEEDVDVICRTARTLINNRPARCLPWYAAVLILLVALGAGVAVTAAFLPSRESSNRYEVIVATLNEQISDLRKAAQNAESIAAARLPAFREIDSSGPWGISWEWQSPSCKGGYNMVVNQATLLVTVYGKGNQVRGAGQALRNGRFFVAFTIDTGSYTLKAEGSIATMTGEAELVPIASIDAPPYCRGTIKIARGRLPDRLIGGGNGGGGN